MGEGELRRAGGELDRGGAGDHGAVGVDGDGGDAGIDGGGGERGRDEDEEGGQAEGTHGREGRQAIRDTTDRPLVP